MILHYTTQEMSLLIMNLLCLNSGGSFNIVTKENNFHFYFDGDKEELREEIYEWLKRRQ